MHKVLVIVGPTSSGKTTLVVDLARKFNGEVVSADSRQVYKGMDIGTGKDLQVYNPHPSPLPKGEGSRRQGEGIPYHLIDVVSPRTNFTRTPKGNGGQSLVWGFTLAQYQNRAYRAIEDILKRGKIPILVGGTGLYVSAVVDGYVLPQAPPDAKLRARLAKWSLLKLRAKLKKLDSDTYRTIDKNNRRRLERAIEIITQTGRPLSAQRVKRAPPYDVLILGLAVPKAELHRRIDQRLKERLKQGMVEEVRRLHRQGVSWKHLESFGLEYGHVAKYLQLKGSKKHALLCDRTIMRGGGSCRCGGRRYGEGGKEKYDEMVRQLSAAIKDFARRQMTWFKRDKRIVWVKNKGKIGRLVREFLEI